MEVIFSEEALADIQYWKKSGNKAIQKKIQLLIEDISTNPFTGLGKPEMLKHELKGKWSRRINQEHRIIYEVIDDMIHVHSLKGHYK